jgi:hypothetical protein
VASKTIIYTLAVLLFLGGITAWFVVRNSAASGSSQNPLTPEAKAYVRNLKLGEVSMKATESYVGQTVTEIEGKISNSGDRVVKHAEVYCIFYNAYGEVVIRERVAIVGTPLKPGETRAFRLPFDDIPEGWNNQMPQLVIARIDFT